MGNLEFTCPSCGGHTFGNRMCHGYVPDPTYGSQPCKFTWTEAEDWLVFHVVRRFTCQQDLDLWRAAQPLETGTV